MIPFKRGFSVFIVTTLLTMHSVHAFTFIEYSAKKEPATQPVDMMPIVNSAMKYERYLPTDDTYVANNSGTKDTVYGNDKTLYSISRPYDNEARKTYIKFDCSDLSNVAITSAKFYIKSNPRKVNGAVQSEVDINLSTIADESWSEKNVTWSSKPDDKVVDKLGSFFYEQVEDTWYCVDITDYLVKKENKIVSLMLTTAEIGAGRCYFYSKESGEANSPYIEITTGLEIAQDVEYTFTDSNGTEVKIPEEKGSVTATMKISTSISAINEARLELLVFDRQEDKLLTKKSSSKALQIGKAVDISCTLDDLPYSEKTLIKTQLTTDFAASQPFIREHTYADSRYPVYPVGQINVAYPEYRSDVTENEITVKLFAPGFDTIKAESMHPPDKTSAVEYNKLVAQKLVPKKDGYVQFDFPASKFPYGPIAITITGVKNGAESKKYLQLYNTVGERWNMGIPDTPIHAKGMKLAYVDDFEGRLSIARNDSRAKYGSHTPYWGDYGSARFEDFEGSYNPFEQRDSFLKIKVRAPEGYEKVDPNGRKYYGGLISSVHPDGRGKTWKYGYFECRMIMPPGIGVWPSFWLLSKNRLDPDRKSTGELDVVEGYLYEEDISKICIARWSFSDDVPQYGDHIKFNMTDAGMLNLCQSFHVYACKITEETIYFYIDDQLAWTYPTYDEVRDEMMFLVNIALGRGGGPTTDLSEYGEGADLYVDYVRVFVP